MMKWAKAALLLLLVFTDRGVAQTYPEDIDPYVVDHANLLSGGEETQLRDTLTELRAARDIEFVVVTINQMSDFGHSGSIEPFATGLFNEWSIGDATRNDGLLLLVSRADRELRIEVGSGYGDTLDGPMQRVISRTIVPYFRDDNYPSGIEAGVDEIIFQVTDRYPGEYDSSDFAANWNAIVRTVSWIFGPWMLFLLIPAAPIGWRLYRRWQRNHARKCPNDGHRMRRYLEETEDVVLNKGQQMEERLKSIDHDVWFCDTCEHITI